MITPGQLRAARGFLDWTRKELAEVSGVSPETIRNIEYGRFRPAAATANKLRLSFLTRGIGFFDALAHFPLLGVVLQPQSDDERLRQEHLGLVNRMAIAITNVMKGSRDCEPHDLELAGFSADEIAVAWPLARALAEVQQMESDPAEPAA